MSKVLRGSFSLLLILSLYLCAFSQVPSPPKEKEVRELLDSLALWAKDANQPGIGLVLVRGDSVLYAGGVGKARLKSHLPMPVRGETNFRVGSISKTFVSLGILKLVEAGKFKLDDKIADLAPEISIRNNWEADYPITVENLLEHTAGFDDMHVRNLYNKTDDPYLPLEKVLERSKKSLTSRWQPGSRHSYSNPGYTILGYLIEKYSGQRYEDFLQKEVLSPLKMKNASFRLEPEIEMELAHGYKVQNDSLMEVPYMHLYHRPAGSLHASPENLAQALLMFLNRGKIDSNQLISVEILERMERSQTTWASSAKPYGYGLGNFTVFVNGHRGQGHNGGIDGFYSNFRYFPDLDCGYAILFNRMDASISLRNKATKAVEELLLPTDSIQPESRVKLEANWKEEMSGYYQSGNPRNQIMAFVTNLAAGRAVAFSRDTLQIEGLFSMAESRIPIENEGFRKVNEAGTTTVLGKWENGEIYLQHGGKFFLKTSNGIIYTGWIGLFGFILMIPVGLLFGLISLLMRVKGKLKTKFLPRAFLGLAPCFLVAAILAAFTLKMMTAGEITTAAIIIFIGLTGFGICSIGGFGTTIWEIIRHKLNGIRILMLLMSFFYLAGTIYLATQGLMPLRLWAY